MNEFYGNLISKMEQMTDDQIPTSFQQNLLLQDFESFKNCYFYVIKNVELKSLL